MLREWNFYNKQWKWFTKLPEILAKGFYSVAKPLFEVNGNYLALDYLRRAAVGDELYWGGGVDLTPIHLKKIFAHSNSSLAELPSSLPSRLHNQARERNPQNDYIQEIEFYELAHRLPELLLMRVDKITMAHSLEARVPFLDHRLVEFTMSIPWRKKIPDASTTKALLKKAAESILPHEIIYRKKQGFAAPVSEWMRTHWYEFAKDTVLQSELVKAGILSEQGLKTLFKFHKDGTRNFGKSLYSLVNLSLWYKKFIS